MLQTDILIELHVPDFETVKEFYGSIGYKIVWEKQSSEEELGYMVLRSEESILNFYGGTERVVEHDYFKKFATDTSRGYGVEIVVPIDGIENFYEKFMALHTDRVVQELNHKHSHKDFRVVDPFGYYLRFVERYDWVNGRDKEEHRIKK